MVARREPFFLTGSDHDHLIDRSGRRYFDLTSGWNVTNAGWSNRELFEDWFRRISALQFRPSWCSDPHQTELSDWLRSKWPSYFPIYACSGGEAVDHATKLARMATGKANVACFAEAYHGSTLGAALVAGYDVGHLETLGLSNRRIILPMPETDSAVDAALEMLSNDEDIGAVVFETILTNAGCRVVPDRFLQRINSLSRDRGFLLVCDEIGTGMNRTGTWWSHETRPVRPDIFTCGKALTNGLYPLSIVMVAEELRPFIDDASFGSTYGGSPSACAAALATVQFHEQEKLGRRALELGEAVARQLVACGHRSGVKLQIRGIGLSMAVDICAPGSANVTRSDVLVRALLERSVFAAASGDGEQLMITPALTADHDGLMHALSVVAECIASIRGAPSQRAS
jgi:4-aminobutyrate aminotransferase-like enzyme